MIKMIEYIIAEAIAAVLVIVIKSIAYIGHLFGLCEKLETIDGDDPVFDVDWDCEWTEED